MIARSCLIAFVLCASSLASAQSWQTVGGESFGAIAGLSDSALVMIRKPGDILRSTDQGGTWHVVERRYKPLIDVEELPSGQVIAQGFGELLLSRDSGRSWVGLDSGDDPVAYKALTSSSSDGERRRGRTAPRDLNINGVRLLLDDSSDILLSHDDGASWRRVLRMTGDYPRKLESIRLVGSVCYAIGEPGLIYVSDASFEHWDELHVAPFQVDSTSHRRYCCIDFFSPALGAIAAGNRLYVTRDSGTTWREHVLRDTTAITSMLLISDTSALVGGAHGKLTLLTGIAAKDGRTTQPLDSVLNTNRPVVQIGWRNRTYGDVYVLTDSSVYFISTYRGTSTSAALPLRPGEYVRSASFPDNYMGYIIADSVTRLDTTITTLGVTHDTTLIWDTSSVYRTSDGGASWNRVASGLRGLSKVSFANAKRGFGCGPNGLMLRTDDSGTTWSRSFASTRQNLNDLRFVNDSTGYVVGDSGVVMSTFNSGLWWRMTAPEPMFSHPGASYTSIAFVDGHTVFVLGQSRCYSQTIRDPFPRWRGGNRRRTQAVRLAVVVNPNPTSGAIRIAISYPGKAPLGTAVPSIVIADVSGRSYDIPTSITSGLTGQWSAEADLSQLPVGPYTVTATLGDAFGFCKLLVAH